MKLIFIVVLFSKLQTRLETPIFDDNLIVLLGSVGIFFSFVKLWRKDRYITPMFLILVMYALLFSFVFTNNSIISYTYSYMFAFIAYVFIVFGTATYFANKNKILVLLKYAYAVITVFMTICYIIYFDNFDTFRNLTSFMNIERTRSAFGFVQANTTADICLAALTIGLLLRVAEKNRITQYGKVFKRWIFLSHIIMIIILISTASRGALLALLALYGCYWYQSVDKYIANKKLFGFVKPMCIGLFALMLGAYIYADYIVPGNVDISYRLANFTVNIPTLISSGRLLTGWGFVNKSVFANGRIISGTGYTDNYYLYVLVTTGIIGCVIMLSYLVILIRGIKARKKNLTTEGELKLYNVVFSVLAMILVFSISQAAFINPASISSMMCMIIMIGYVVRPIDERTKVLVGGEEN